MSVAVDVLLLLDRLPRLDQWQNAITSAGFDLKLDESLDLTSGRGFTPCQLDGQDTGFVLDLDLLEDTQYSELGSTEFDRCVGLTVPAGLGADSIAAAIVASATLAKLAKGTIAVDGEAMRDEEPIAWARQTLRELSEGP